MGIQGRDALPTYGTVIIASKNRPPLHERDRREQTLRQDDSSFSTLSEKAPALDAISQRPQAQPDEPTLTRKLLALPSLLHLAAGISVASMAAVLALHAPAIAIVSCRDSEASTCTNSATSIEEIWLAAHGLAIAAGILNAAAGGIGWAMFARRPRALLVLSQGLAGVSALTSGVVGIMVVVDPDRLTGSPSWQCENWSDVADCEQFWTREVVVAGLHWLCVGIVSLQLGYEMYGRKKDPTIKSG